MSVFPVAGLSFVLLFSLLTAETGQAQVGSNTFLITAPPPPSNYLQLVTFTAVVTGSDGGDPTGTVTFTTQNGSRLCIPVPLTQVSGASMASCATATLPVGANTVTAAYSGDSNYNPSNGSALYTVNGNIPTTTLSVSPPAPVTGQIVTLTATVSNNGDPVTSGTVTFIDSEAGPPVLGTAQLVQSGPAAGTATLKIRLAPGMYVTLARFNGITGNQESLSDFQQFTVTGTEPSLTTLTDQPDGNNFDFTATVFGFGYPTPTGIVIFLDNTAMANLGSMVLAGPGTSAFQPQQAYGTGASPAAVASGDFNGDGFPDLAIANLFDNTVSVLLGNGDGTFQPQQVLAAGMRPVAVAIGDFNGDGFADLAIANQGDSTVSVMLGNGDGTFQPALTYGVGTGPNGLAVGDFNGDGFLDLATANYGDGTVSVLLNSGDGTFQPQQSSPAGAQPFQVAAGDFNGDGLADLAVTNFGSATVSVLLGQGNGTFQPPQAYGVGNLPWGVSVADFNFDGFPDLVVANHGSDTVSVLLGNGDGTFQPQVPYATGTPNSVVTGDFNGDGFPDLAVANDKGTVGVLLGNGDGTFQPQQTYEVGQEPNSLAVADFNGDGVSDIATANYDDNSASILLGGITITGQIINIPIAGSGIHIIQSSYMPDAASIFAGSASNIVMVPAGGKAIPTVTLQATPTEINLGNSIAFVAAVSSSGNGTPTGTVTFVDGATPLGTGSVDATGTARFMSTSLVLGQHSITATYNGDSNYSSATSNVVTVQVDTPFVLQSTSYSATVPPGGNTQFQINVIAAYQSNPLVYAALSCTPPAGSGITCSVACPPGPPGLPASCVLTSSTELATVTVNAAGGSARAVPLPRGGRGRPLFAAVMGLGGFGLLGLVMTPVKLRRKAAGGILFLVIVALCFGTSCTGNFAPGTSSAPVNNTFYISVNAELREEIGGDPTQFRKLGLQQFWFTLLIK